VLVVIAGGLVIGGAVRTSRARRHRAELSLARDTVMIGAGVVQGTVRRALIPAGQSQPTPPGELRRQVENLAAGTYISDILEEQDSALYRWPEHFTDALRVYVEPSSTVANWDARYPQMARNVFAEWSEAGFPLRFTFIYDSASADITIHWVDRFPAEEGQRIGVTDRVQTSTFQIAKAHVRVANHDSTGRALSVTTVGGIMRHEIGHALGLNHARDASSVMYRESATATIGNSDRATLRLLYLVPGGSLK
jgi:predicted Zn-dependent protease